MVAFRILTYNVRSFRGDKDGLIRVVGESDPDVLCLQEAPKHMLWRNACASFARRADLLYVAGGRPTGGTAIFTPVRVDVRGVRELRLSKTPSLTSRGMVIASLSKGAAVVSVASVHLGLDAAERARHLTEITGMLDPAPVTVLAGDINEEPGAPTWARLTTEFADAGAADPAPTFPARRPDRRIDAIFVRGDAKVVRCEVLDTPGADVASDHRPVVADVEVSVPSFL